MSEHSLPYFIDTNIFIYSVGQDHAVKPHCVAVIQKIRDGKIKAVVSTEIIQEILYRFQAMRELPYGIRLAREVILVSSQILPVTERDLSLAMEILESCPQIETRDSFHAATMRNNAIGEIISVDRDFDLIPKIKRIDPMNFG